MYYCENMPFLILIPPLEVQAKVRKVKATGGGRSSIT